MSDSVTCVDLFCGAGGFSLGFTNAGFTILAAADKNESALKTYESNFDHPNIVNVDLSSISPSKFCKKTSINPNNVDVVIGGPPCKGFSIAGKMDPNDPRNFLIGNYINLVEYLDPSVVVMENVTGILYMSDGEYKRRIISGFRELGYEVSNQPVILTAADYGVPQLRDRVFFIASKEGIIKPPTPTHKTNDKITSKKLEGHISVKDAIHDLSYLGSGEESSDYKLQTTTDYQREMRARSDSVHNHKATNHGKTVRDRFDLFEPGQQMSDLPEKHQTAKHSMRRWNPQDPAPTVTTLPEDFIHYCRNRIPTVRELARIQSFPDDFIFKGPRTTGGSRRKDAVPQYTQVGNAVPPKLAEAIGNEILCHIKKRVTI